ncbi:hypothetical protein KO527_06895 [Pseudoalteromonas sp. C2R02]|uniref:hypothetical protein n=1 Tax=Pseudoalteromonas sp. C2R02 TaxID=2841565 RepID=UPI001C08935E|nr:hypothetical protein [Pseudoalteromonas sp. C2R02]MBU2969070.1 hypothetical protein [Pseudoalteromonas sp. C2R02]
MNKMDVLKITVISRLLLSAALCLAALAGVLFLIFILKEAIFDRNEISKLFSETPIKSMVSELVQLIVLFFITVFSFRLTKDILNKAKSNELKYRANTIAVMVGLMTIFAIFQQQVLDIVFKDMEPNMIIGALLFGGGAGAGWFSWFLKKIDNYGELFHVYLLVVTAGFGWYARLTENDSIQLIFLSFVFGSLVRLGFDYVDQSNQLNKETQKLVAK